MALSTTFNVKDMIEDSLKSSASMVRSFISKDRESPDLLALLNRNTSQGGTGTISGLQEQDYPNLNLPEVSTIKNIPLPPELVEQFSNVQCNSLIGIFPEIGRIWVTVDSTVFIWHYTAGEGFAYFDNLSEAIFNVALVRPKEGTFQEHIKYLLVITTIVEIVILGVSFVNNDINMEMHLLPDPLFTMQAENCGLHTMGISNGRIFTGGKDGCLYEITYKGGSGWFGTNCAIKNHSKNFISMWLPKLVGQWFSEDDGICQIVEDDTRNILYTRSTKGTLVVYDLGEDSHGMSYIARLTINDIKNKVRNICNGNTIDSNSMEIVHIASVTKRESRYIHLVAVTQTGVRLYFVTSHSNIGTMPIQNFNVNNATGITSMVAPTNPNARPSMLSLVHVRLPPGFTPTSINLRPSSVVKAFSNNGVVLLSSESKEGHKLWCIRRPSFPSEKVLMESQITLQLDGKLWILSEVEEEFDPRSIAPLPNGMTLIPPDPPIQVQQHFKKAKEFVTIGDQGCYLFSTLRPIDQLRYLFEKSQDVTNEKIRIFFEMFGMGEAISASVIIAMCSYPSDGYLKDKAIEAFYAYAGKPCVGVPTPSTEVQSQFVPQSPNMQQTRLGSLMSPIPGGQPRHNYTHIDPNTTATNIPVISTPMPNAQPASHFTYPQSTNPQGSDLCFSNMHSGLYKTFGRLVRPVWEAHFMRDLIVQRGKQQELVPVCCIETDLLSLVINDLQGFNEFLEKYCLPKLPKMAALGQYMDETVPHSTYLQQNHQQRLANKQAIEAVAEESKSIRGLHSLTKTTIEVLGLWRIASQHQQVGMLCKNLTKQSQTALKSATLENFVMNAKELSSILISAFVNFYIADNTDIDGLNDQLNKVCPELYSPDDAVCSKAFELISTARSLSGNQRQEQLESALHLFQQVSHVVNIPTVVQQFKAAQFYTGVVELCSTAAHKIDEKNIALHYYLNERDSENDVVGNQALTNRNSIYSCITGMLDDLVAVSLSAGQSTTQIGPPQPATEHGTTQEEAERFAETCIQLALKSTDELLHIFLYHWMLSKGFSKNLLAVKSPFLEKFLKKVTADQTSGYTIDLLWTYYEKNSHHISAAKILANLADIESVDMQLSQRIEYLSRAKMNCKSAISGSDVAQMLHTLEEKLEVAQIQLLVLNSLKDCGFTDVMAELDRKLVDITTLYNEYADAYNLAECKLAIVHCAEHYDATLVNTLWQSIVTDTFKRSTQNQSFQVMQKVVHLGKQYFGSGRYFPLTFLVSFLEEISCENEWPLDCVALGLLSCGTNFTQLVQEYDSVYSLKSECWEKLDRPYHLIEVLSSMLDKFADNPSSYITGPMQRQFTTHILDMLARYLVQLQSISVTNDHLNITKQALKNNQAKIERLEHQLSQRY